MPDGAAEDPGHRLKRLRMRSWRRGTKEMDLILGPFSDTQLAGLSAAELDTYDAILSENDHELYLWITGRKPVPEPFGALIARVTGFAGLEAAPPVQP